MGKGHARAAYAILSGRKEDYRLRFAEHPRALESAVRNTRWRRSSLVAPRASAGGSG